MSAGGGIRRASWVGTGIFVVTAVAAVAAPSTFEPEALAVAAGLFAAGCGLFVWAFFVTAGRSRTAEMELAQIWFLMGPPTPPEVRRSLLGSFAVEVVAGLATAGARPYTSLAAGVLVPVYGLALCGLWAGRHAAFPPRQTVRRQRDRDLRSGHDDQGEQHP
jgi:hypothetical protein